MMLTWNLKKLEKTYVLHKIEASDIEDLHKKFKNLYFHCLKSHQVGRAM